MGGKRSTSVEREASPRKKRALPPRRAKEDAALKAELADDQTASDVEDVAHVLATRMHAPSPVPSVAPTLWTGHQQGQPPAQPPPTFYPSTFVGGQNAVQNSSALYTPHMEQPSQPLAGYRGFPGPYGGTYSPALPVLQPAPYYVPSSAPGSMIPQTNQDLGYILDAGFAPGFGPVPSNRYPAIPPSAKPEPLFGRANSGSFDVHYQQAPTAQSFYAGFGQPILPSQLAIPATGDPTPSLDMMPFIGPSTMRSASMSISALLAMPEGPTESQEPVDDAGLPIGPATTGNSSMALQLFEINNAQTDANSAGPSLWDTICASGNITDSLEFLFAPLVGQQPLFSIPLVPAPGIQPGVFDDLPPIPDQSIVAQILELFFAHVNPQMSYIVHVPSFFGRKGGDGELLLLFAILAAAAPSLPISQPTGHAISLAFFRRAQRILQPILGTMIQIQPPTIHQLCAILIMASHASTAFSSSQLGYQLGMYLVGLLRTWRLIGDSKSESRNVELYLAMLENGIQLGEQQLEQLKAAVSANGLYGTVIEREQARRVAWQTYVVDKTASTVTPFLGQHGSIPFMPVSTVSGLLLPCDNEIWLAEQDAVVIASSLSGFLGEEVVRESIGSVPDLQTKSRVWWQLRLHSILCRIVEYHVVRFVCFPPFCLPF